MECLKCFDSKSTWFFVCENKSNFVATITTKHANKFC